MDFFSEKKSDMYELLNIFHETGNYCLQMHENSVFAS